MFVSATSAVAEKSVESQAAITCFTLMSEASKLKPGQVKSRKGFCRGRFIVTDNHLVAMPQRDNERRDLKTA
jgi:hypothetical protein